MFELVCFSPNSTPRKGLPMEPLLENLKQLVTCPICSKTLTKPKTIACLHTFCCECLEEYAVTTQRDGNFRCPECQAVVAVPDRFDKLPTGFLQDSLLVPLAVQSSGDGCEVNCGSCKVKCADISFCFECGQFLCPECVNSHERLRNIAFKGHKVRLIKQFQNEDYEALLKRQPFCSHQDHDCEKEIRFFCNDCQTCVCQTCIETKDKNHSFDPLDKAAAGQKAKVMAATESIKEMSKACSNVIRELEETAADLKRNANAAKRKVSEAAEQMISKIREREQEAIIELENICVARMEKLNAALKEVQSLLKQLNHAVDFANNLVQRGTSSVVMQSKNNLEKRFEDLNKTAPFSALPVSSFVKFVSTVEVEKLSTGFVSTIEADLRGSAVEGLTQDFQAGIESEIVICPKPASQAKGKFHVGVLVEPAEQVGDLMTFEKEDGKFLVRFTPKVPGTNKIHVTLNGDNLYNSPFNFKVKERRLEVVGELDFKEERAPQNPSGMAVNSKGLIAVANKNGHSILIFDKDGKYLRKFGSYGHDAGQLYHPSSVSFLSDDKILIADDFNHRIQQFDVNTGKVLQVFGRSGTGDGEFLNPVCVCMDDEGHVVVTDFNNSTIKVLREDGEPVFNFGGSGPDKLNHPTGCILHQSTFIVCDTWNNCLKVFDRSGKFLRKFGEKGKGDGQLEYPRSLCVEKRGSHHNILVCDRHNQRVVQFSLEGSFTGKTDTHLPEPVGIAVTPDGRILVSDYKAKTIYILK